MSIDKSEKEIQEKLKILEEIQEAGEKLSKKSLKEFYEIAERKDEDWENR